MREDQRDYCLAIGGQGTGLNPPTEEEWVEIADRVYTVDRISIDPTIQSLSSVDHSIEPWFPPIGNQDGEARARLPGYPSLVLSVETEEMCRRRLFDFFQPRTYFTHRSEVLDDPVGESNGFTDKYNKKEAVASCEKFKEQIEEARMLLQHVRDVESESARQTLVLLNRELLVLWERFFKKCPETAKDHLRKPMK